MAGLAQVDSLIKRAFADASHIKILDAWNISTNARILSGMAINHPYSVLTEYLRLRYFLIRNPREWKYVQMQLKEIDGYVRYEPSQFTWIHGDCKGLNYIQDTTGMVHIIDVKILAGSTY